MNQIGTPHEQIPELAIAFCDVLLAKILGAERELTLAAGVWNWFADNSWPENEFDEQKTVLATLAFNLSIQCRKFHNYRAMRYWEGKCSQLVAEVEPSRSYLGAFATETSVTADRRVLEDPSLLLAFCRQQEALRSVNPSLVLSRSKTAFTLLRDKIDAEDSAEKFGYFAADLAQSAASAASHLRYPEACAWAQAAEYYLELVPSCRWLLPLAAGMRIIMLSVMNEHRVLLEEAPAVARKLESLGADLCVISVRLCEVQASKCLREYERAVLLLNDLISKYANGDPMRMGFAHAQLADTMIQIGDLHGAIRHCQIAFPLLREGKGATGIPYLQAVVSQLYRAMGRTEEAVNALRESADSYLDTELKPWAGYNRILAAEILLLSERVNEALEELAAALPLLRGSTAEHELLAAMQLLRAAVAAANPVNSQLRGFRERLELIRKGHF